MIKIIAEIGQNHNGDMHLAADLIAAAAENGADIAKFQLFDAKALFPSTNNPWYEYNLKTELTRDQLSFIFEKCASHQIEFMSSCFDLERLEWLEELGVSSHKVASRSIHESELISAVLKTGKPTLISLGMWNEPKLPVFQSALNPQIIFLHCVSDYPADLKSMKISKVNFSDIEGFSDHTVGLTASKAAMARGAKYIEKHFTLNQSDYGPDHVCSMEPYQLQELSKFRDELIQCL